MTDTGFIIRVVLVVTVLLLAMAAMVGILLVLNTASWQRHRAEMAEMGRQRDLEVINAEREATGHALQNIGRDLHDSVGQLLTMARMGLFHAMRGPMADHAGLQASMDALEEGIQEVRRLGRSLNVDLWRGRLLEDALRAEAERFERLGHVQLNVIIRGTSKGLSDDSKTILFRSFQEVMNNALKHSGADRIVVRMDEGPPFQMRITDNGAGFDPDHVEAGGGTMNLDRRSQLIGFRSKLETAPGRGCSWTFTSINAYGT